MPALPTGANTPNNPYYQRRNNVKLSRSQESRSVFITGPAYGDFSLLNPAIALFGMQALSREADAITLLSDGSDPRKRVVWPIFPTGTRVRFTAQVTANLRFRLATDNQLGPSGTAEIVPVMQAGTHVVDALIPAYSISTHMGFLALSSAQTFIISNWRVDYPSGLGFFLYGGDRLFGANDALFIPKGV